MGTIQKLFRPTAKKDKKVTTKTVKIDPIPDSERASFSPRYTAKNNRKRTRGRKFHFQQLNKPNKKGKRAIKHMTNEAR